ncbi:MAG TPA: hypothetical protein VGH28_06860 [Polyangiaceae bacterium]
MKTPLAQVKDKHGDKAKLVAAIEKLAGDDLWLDRTNKNKGLGRVANAKLVRLHATFSAVKEKFGSRDKLIDAILEIEKRTKDEGEKTRLAKYPVPRLWDMYRSLSAKSGVKPAAAKPVAKRAPAEKKAPAKPAKKAAAKSKA